MKGFYKAHSDGAIQRSDAIHTPSYSLTEANKDEARDGWKWFDDAESAYAFFANPVESPPYEVLPEGFFLATAESDQNAFTRLLQLLGTAQAPDEMPVTIADADGQKHVVTVARLKQILVGYGFEIHSRWAS